MNIMDLLSGELVKRREAPQQQESLGSLMGFLSQGAQSAALPAMSHQGSGLGSALLKQWVGSKMDKAAAEDAAAAAKPGQDYIANMPTSYTDPNTGVTSQLSASDLSRYLMKSPDSSTREQGLKGYLQAQGAIDAPTTMTPLMGATGAYAFNHRTGKAERVLDENKNPILGAQYDPALQRSISAGKQGGLESQKVWETKNDQGQQIFVPNPAGVTGPQDNNFGNMRPVGSSTGFQQFATPEEGLSAMDKQLQIYGSKHGINTIEGLVNRWAPASDNNNPAQYAKFVADKAGIKPDTPIDLANPAQRQIIGSAMMQREKGPGTIFNAAPRAYGQSSKALAEIKTQQALAEQQGKNTLELPQVQALNDLKTNQALAESAGKNALEIQKANNEKNAAKAYNANQALPDLEKIKSLIPSAYGSGVARDFGARASYIGLNPGGADSQAQLESLSASLVMNMPKLAGPVSDSDLEQMKKQAGDLSNPEIPQNSRIKTANMLIEKMQRNSEGGAVTETKEIGGKVYKKINGEWHG